MKPVIWTITGYATIIILFKLSQAVIKDTQITENQWAALITLGTIAIFGLMAIDITNRKY